MGREGRRRRGRLAPFCLEAAEDPGPTVMLRMRRARLVKGQKEKRMRKRGASNDNKATRPKNFQWQQAQARGRQAGDGRPKEIEMGGKGVIECEKSGKWR